MSTMKRLFGSLSEKKRRPANEQTYHFKHQYKKKRLEQ